MMRNFRTLVRVLFAAAFALLPLLTLAPVAYAAQPVPMAQDEPVDSLDGVESAVVQIEAVGTFADPSEGRQQNVPGFGSGFIIDPTGIAVTNNHVVTGGALFRVFVSGRDEPVNARVLGVSECSDIAVIDLSGEEYPFLSWYEERPRVGLDVYAAGFPLGDPEFTLTRGIVSKASADGESNWASLDSVIMHDAEINPGNSGGPLVTEEGLVVGVNYAVDQENDQSFAIPGSVAQDLVETLRTGVDLDSIGINGEAYDDGDGFSAIYVYSVASGSPADVTGILPGDFLLEVEGIAVGIDNTMQDYCDILASHDPADVLSVLVYRPDTDEILEGQLNGRVLESSFSIADQVEGETGDGAVSTVTDDTEYVPLSDPTGLINIEVPKEWSDTDQRDWKVDDEVRGTQLIAAPDVEEFFDSWNVPGVVLSFSDNLQEDWTADDLVDTLDYRDQCTYVGRENLPDDSFFTGVYDTYEKCGVDTVAIVAALVPKTGDYMLGIEVYAPSDAALDALDHILDTFYYGAGSASPAVADVGSDIFDLVDVSGLEHEYTFLNDPYLNALVPSEWTDVVSEDWIGDDDEVLGKKVTVAPDVSAYNDSWDAPGLSAYLISDVGEDFDPVDLLGEGGFSDTCTLDETVTDFEHEIYGLRYTGAYEVYGECDGADTIFYTGVFGEASGGHAYFLDLVAASEADDEAWETLLQSFFLGSAVTAEVNTEEYTTVTDDTGRISVSVPNAWSDTLSAPWEIDGDVVGIEFTAAPDVQEFTDSWEAAGVEISVYDDFGSLDADELLDDIDLSDDCDYDARYDYDNDDDFAGKYDLWVNCGGVEGSIYGVFALQQVADDSMLTLVSLGLPTEEDLSALEPILTTLTVQPPPGDEEAQSPPAAEPEVQLAEEPASQDAGALFVTITTDTLNVRTGPGTTYDRIATISRDASLQAVGQWNGCAWLLVEDVDGERGWVSGDPQFTRLEGDCALLPEGEVLAAPAAATAPAAPSANTGSAGSATAASGQGCVTFKNQVGIELNITLTRSSDNWNTTFTIGKNASGGKCLDPGRYTYTAASWDGRSLNDVLDIVAGENWNIDLNP